MEYKICPRCGEAKRLDAFHKNRSRADGRQSVCKVCQRAYVQAHYAKRPLYYKKKAVEHTRKKRAILRRMIRQAKDAPCADCNGRFPYYVMDLDHVRGEKRFDVGRGLSNWNVQDVKQEIAKCQAVCANCRRVREHKRSRQKQSGE